MDLKAFRKRLLAFAQDAAAPRRREPLVYGRRLPRRSANAGAARAGAGKEGGPRGSGRAPGPGRPVALSEALSGREVEGPSGGRALAVETLLPAPCGPAGADPEGLLFVDIESTGLGSSPLFLIGVMTRAPGGRLRVLQLLARDYSEEAAVIGLFLREAERARRLVSFNGKSYDLPYIRMRAAATGVPFGLALPHTDLLHASRRIWGGVLPNCRLQTLERMVLDRPRDDDIPGREIPDAYHAFVRTGDAAEVARIVTHNRRDLVTLAELLALTEPGGAPGPRPAVPLDIAR